MKTNSFKRLITVYLLVIFGIISTLTSCVQTKQIVYFQGDTAKFQSLNSVLPRVKKISCNDILAIVVNSLNDESNLLVNTQSATPLTYSNFSNTSGLGKSQPLGYTVDSLGYISIPLIGKVKVKDLSLMAASDTIASKLSVYLKDPTVTIKILNHKFSILGEVNRPGIYNLLEERVTLPEGIAMAGDLTIFGKRNNILLIRESKSGKLNLIRIDLTSKDVLTSPHYYIEQNDVIYVEPLKTKATMTDQNYQLIPIFTGVVTALGILILNVRR